MKALFRTVGAQVSTEVRARLRSAATVVAFLALLAGSYFWIPNPASNATSMSWEDAAGVAKAPLYTSAYLGIATAMMASVFLLLAAFYFVAGSIRRDRERGIGAILAATPVSSGAYLLGKWAANASYILVLSLLSLPVGLYAFFRFGVGPFRPAQLVMPLLLSAVPAAAFIAAMALLFDVTPGLRGRGGLVIWFFVSVWLLVWLPHQLAGGNLEGKKAVSRESRQPVFDPAGTVTLEVLIRRSIPEAATSISTGLILRDKPIDRVEWNGFPITLGLVGARALSILWAIPPFLAALLLFDRFDPSRAKRPPAFRRKVREAVTPAAIDGSPGFSLSQLGAAAIAARPTAFLATLADARLTWDTASFLKWLLAASALVAAFVPGDALMALTAIFLILLIPVISEAAAREEIAGARALVFSQPGVPASAVFWKLQSTALLLGVLSLPIALRLLVTAPGRALAFVSGLLFVAAFSVAAASLTGGGKLFSGAYVALWYIAVNRVPAFDYCGVFSATTVFTHAAFLLAGAALIGAAFLQEGRRRLA